MGLSYDSCRGVMFLLAVAWVYGDESVHVTTMIPDDVTSEDQITQDTNLCPMTCGTQKHPAAVFVVGGVEAYPHSWPWQISIRVQGGHSCGGTIISKRWIITAAHCVDYYHASQMSVLAGAHSKLSSVQEPSRQQIQVEEVIIHEEYYTMDKDIALLHLAADLEWTDAVKPACMPSEPAPVGQQCIVTGWGNTMGTGDSLVLNQVQVPIISHARCSSSGYYGTMINEFMVCAGYQAGGKDTCQGDSGGPLVCPGGSGACVLHGVTSWGFGCAEPNKPGVYARVSALMEWLSQHTNEDFFYG